MKKRIAAALLALLCLLMTACANNDGEVTDVPDGMKAIEFEGTFKAMFIPESWTEDSSSGFAAAVYESDRSSVSFTEFSAGDDITDAAGFWEDYRAQLEGSFSEFKLDGEPYETEFSGISGAQKVVYSASVAGVTYKYMQIIVFVDRPYALGLVSDCRIYIFTYTALPDNYETHLDDVDKIVDNFIFS